MRACGVLAKEPHLPTLPSLEGAGEKDCLALEREGAEDRPGFLTSDF
jgi:hypothetical protein